MSDKISNERGKGKKKEKLTFQRHLVLEEQLWQGNHTCSPAPIFPIRIPLRAGWLRDATHTWFWSGREEEAAEEAFENPL